MNKYFSEGLLSCLETITDKVVDLNSKIEDLQDKIQGSEEKVSVLENKWESNVGKDDPEEISDVLVEEEDKVDTNDSEPKMEDDKEGFFSSSGFVVVKNKKMPYGLKVIHTSEFSESLHKPVYSTVFSQKTRAYCAKNDYENNNVTRYCRVK